MFNKGVIREFLFLSLGFGFIIGITIGITEESKKLLEYSDKTQKVKIYYR